MRPLLGPLCPLLVLAGVLLRIVRLLLIVAYTLFGLTYVLFPVLVQFCLLFGFLGILLVGQCYLSLFVECVDVLLVSVGDFSLKPCL